MTLCAFNRTIYLREMNIEVLSAGHENDALEVRNRYLALSGFQVTAASSMAKTINAIFESSFDVVLLCNSFSAEERRMLVALVARYCPSVPLVLISDLFDRNRYEHSVYSSSANIRDLMAAIGRAVEKAHGRKRLAKAA